MSTLADVIFVEDVALKVDPGTEYTELIQLDRLDIKVIPNVHNFTKKGGDIVQFVNKIRLTFKLSADVFVSHTSFPQKDVHTIYQDFLGLADITLYPDATKQASGDGFAVVCDFNEFTLERFRRGTRSQAFEFNFRTKSRLDPNVLTYFKRK